MQKRLAVFKRFIQDLATLSKCSEYKVAAIITDIDMKQVYSIGINGGPAGLSNCLCADPGKHSCIHAEMNALIKNTTNDTNKIMLVTLAPCEQCAAAIINSGFSKVYYIEDWKDNPGVKLLKNADIDAIKIYV